jgi:hypothetical protein
MARMKSKKTRPLAYFLDFVPLISGFPTFECWYCKTTECREWKPLH